MINGFVTSTEIFVPKIKVIGAGGGGGNVVTKMVNVGVKNVEFITCNTDMKALNRTTAELKIELGKNLTRGLGAGAKPEIGEAAARETLQELEAHLEGANMVFIAAGMGGGTGTGSAPVIAELSKKKNILTVGVVTTPFSFEGKKRMRVALQGIEKLKGCTDTLLVIPNDKLLDASNQTTSLLDAFHLADEVLMNAIQGITDLINHVGTINVDFADVKTIMENMGRAVIGKGTAAGDDRMRRAAWHAINSPLMEDTDIRGAKGILVHVMGSNDMGLLEINEAIGSIQEMADDDVNIIFGATTLDDMRDHVTVTVIATGLPHHDHPMP
ncbi:MAG: cell division protein FtsZ [SAR324 cluster bacterium]|nr:cell division protein FtsZ [SAR324 cluster bacterium]